MYENYYDCHHRKTMRTYIYTKRKKLRNVFIYKKPYTFQKARQSPLRFYIQKAVHFTLRDLHEIFEVGIYIQKAWHFALRDVFIYKKVHTSQKARQFAIRFYIQKSGTLRSTIFHWIFEICGGGGHLFLKNTIHLRYVAIYKVPDTMRYILISKKLCTFRFLYIHIIYRVVLIPNYKRTYDQSDQIEK